eukprot:m.146956 g.146956  ORF g.146956 m.146956 type:complete len:543 (-) comp16248_c0_seq2:1596-3224(-)
MFWLSAYVLLPVLAASLNNGLGRLPGLGWNSDYCTNCSTASNGFENEAFIKHIADTFVSMGLQNLGYHYVNMDSKWDTPTRDGNGNLQPDPTLWPSGMDVTIDYVHSKGLGFGLYGDRGTKDCAKNPGALGHEQQDADFFAKNQVDWYKEDACYAAGDEKTALEEYANMSKALNATGRPIWFALCGWKPWYAYTGKSIANSWRVGPDTICGWDCIMENVNNALSVAAFPGPSANGGGWNDLCLLLTPGFSSMSNDQHRAQFSLYSVLAANMLMTGNLSALNDYVIETWTNKDAIGINQDPAGYPALLMQTVNASTPSPVTSSLVPASLTECGGEPELQTWNYNDPMVGFLHNLKQDSCLNAANCGSTVIYDGCSTTGGTCSGPGKFNNEQWLLPREETSGTIESNMSTSAKCLTASQNKVKLAVCDGDANQQWTYTSSKQIQTAAGLCLTAAAPVNQWPSQVIGREMANGDFALLMLNNDMKSVNMTCDSDCWAKSYLPEGRVMQAYDVWSKQVVGTATVGDDFTMEVPSDGAARLFRLTGI